MLNKICTITLLLVAFALQTEAKMHHGKHHSSSSSSSSSSSAHGLPSFAVFANQVAITSGENVPWDSSNPLNTPNIVTDGAGHITILTPGIYLVEYTVRITEQYTDPSSIAVKNVDPPPQTAIVQLQQTSGGVPTNIRQQAVNSVFIGLTTSNNNSYQTQIVGWALVRVTSTKNNVLNLAVLLGLSESIPAATGDDANAEITILQVH